MGIRNSECGMRNLECGTQSLRQPQAAATSLYTREAFGCFSRVAERPLRSVTPAKEKPTSNNALLCRGRFTPPRHESREIQVIQAVMA